jgi:hypothetical protein
MEDSNPAGISNGQSYSRIWTFQEEDPGIKLAFFGTADDLCLRRKPAACVDKLSIMQYEESRRCKFTTI